MHKTLLAMMVIGALSVLSFAQQDNSARPSPPAQAQCKFSDGKTITVDYSSPRMKGRKILGGLVPYGEVWRTGANEATTFVTTTDLAAAKGTNIPAGSYTIFTIPESDKWTLIVNKHTGEWGTPYKYQSEELAHVPMSVAPTSSRWRTSQFPSIIPAEAAPCVWLGRTPKPPQSSRQRTPIYLCNREAGQPTSSASRCVLRLSCSGSAPQHGGFRVIRPIKHYTYVPKPPLARRLEDSPHVY